MKKFLTIVSLLLLVGCGSDFKYEGKNEKKEFLTKLIKTNDPKLQEEYDKIIADLEAKTKKYDDKAIEELEEWNSIYFQLAEKYNVGINVDNKSSGLGDLFSGKRRRRSN